MTRHAIRDSRFAERLMTVDASLSDSLRRSLLYRYATLYQDVYWFDQLESAFALLELTDNRPASLPDEIPAVIHDIECAMGEYFESLNHVSTALHRLFNDRPMTQDDVLDSIGLIWDAHGCNETPDEYISREDAILCDLIASLVPSNGG